MKERIEINKIKYKREEEIEKEKTNAAFIKGKAF